MNRTPAQRAASRANGAKSQGPITDAGKAISRQNAVKHGMTGEGVALPNEDAVEVSRRFVTLERELKPQTEFERILVRRVAVCAHRLERSVDQETAALSEKVRGAEAAFDDHRAREVELLVRQLPLEPATAARRLQLTVEGLDWLLHDWSLMKLDLIDDNRDVWSWNHRQRFENLLGRPIGHWSPTRVGALCEAITGNFAFLHPEDGAELGYAERANWARDELSRLIDAEMARLSELRGQLDHEKVARDRAEAGRRAKFDDGPKASLARKYEAAAERGMFRAWETLQRCKAIAAKQEKTETCEVSGSFEPEVGKAAEPPAEPVKETFSWLPSPPKITSIGVIQEAARPVETPARRE